MPTFTREKSLYYHDVNLIACPSAVESRMEVPYCLNKVIVAPMHAVIGKDFVKQAAASGLTIALHRFCDIEYNVELFNAAPKDDCHRVFASIGIDDWKRVDALNFAGVRNYLIDCANGYLPQIQRVIEKLCTRYNVDRLMVGNIMSSQGVALYRDVYRNYPDLKEFLIRVGIGNGSACATSEVTGYNRGQITELIECAEEAVEYGIKIIADGGVKDGSCAAKAFGCGADYVMMGGYFARAECAFTWKEGDGTYWGGASTKQQSLNKNVKRHSEGKVYSIPPEEKKTMATLVTDLQGALSSAVSYSGYSALEEFIGNGIFEIKN